MLDLLRSLEWAGGSDADGWCPTCGGAGRHEPDCPLDRAIRGLSPEPTVDEMAREMGFMRYGPFTYGAPGAAGVCSPDEVHALYREHKAKQIDATLAGKRVGPWLTPPAPKVYEASGIVEQPPTDPSALAAWLYARVMPGRTAVEYRTAAGIVGKSLVARCYAGTDRVALGIYGGETVLVPGQGSTLLTFTRLLNPDGTVLWEAT
jgi:hypothetical protein